MQSPSINTVKSLWLDALKDEADFQMEERGRLSNAVGNWSGGSETNGWGGLWNQLDRIESANLYPCPPQGVSAGHRNSDARGYSDLMAVMACLLLHSNALAHARNRFEQKERKHYLGWQPIHSTQATGPKGTILYPANKCRTAAVNCGAGKG